MPLPPKIAELWTRLGSIQASHLIDTRVVMPEMRLLEAILLGALRNYTLVAQLEQRTPEQEREFLEDQEWFADTTRCDWFSFEGICELVGLDPAAVRSRLGIAPTRRGKGYTPFRHYQRRAS